MQEHDRRDGLVAKSPRIKFHRPQSPLEGLRLLNRQILSNLYPQHITVHVDEYGNISGEFGTWPRQDQITLSVRTYVQVGRIVPCYCRIQQQRDLELLWQDFVNAEGLGCRHLRRNRRTRVNDAEGLRLCSHRARLILPLASRWIIDRSQR